jgi:hypothetical protein
MLDQDSEICNLCLELQHNQEIKQAYEDAWENNQNWGLYESHYDNLPDADEFKRAQGWCDACQKRDWVTRLLECDDPYCAQQIHHDCLKTRRGISWPRVYPPDYDFKKLKIPTTLDCGWTYVPPNTFYCQRCSQTGGGPLGESSGYDNLDDDDRFEQPEDYDDFDDYDSCHICGQEYYGGLGLCNICKKEYCHNCGWIDDQFEESNICNNCQGRTPDPSIAPISPLWYYHDRNTAEHNIFYIINEGDEYFVWVQIGTLTTIFSEIQLDESEISYIIKQANNEPIIDIMGNKPEILDTIDWDYCFKYEIPITESYHNLSDDDRFNRSEDQAECDVCGINFPADLIWDGVPDDENLYTEVNRLSRILFPSGYHPWWFCSPECMKLQLQKLQKEVDSITESYDKLDDDDRFEDPETLFRAAYDALPERVRNWPKVEIWIDRAIGLGGQDPQEIVTYAIDAYLEAGWPLADTKSGYPE